MNILSLARHLMDTHDLKPVDLARECGLSKQAIHRRLQRPYNPNYAGFVLGVLKLAFKHGYEAEALSLILGVQVTSQQLTMFIARSLYFDLPENEIQELQSIEKTLGVSPLSPAFIKCVVEDLRS